MSNQYTVQDDTQIEPPTACGWTDFTSSWNAFGGTSSSESGSSSSWWSLWQPALRESEEESYPATPRSQESNELARAKRQANSSHQGNDRSRMKQLKKMTSTDGTVTSASSESDEDESMWDPSRLEAINKIVSKQEQQQQQQDQSKGCCQGFRSKSFRYKFGVLLLVLAILVCAVVVVLTSVDISSSASEASSNDNLAKNSKNLFQENDDVETKSPTETPSQPPTLEPSTPLPITNAPTESIATYIPGKLTVSSNGLLLSEGLSSRIIARSGQPVTLDGLPPLQTSNSDGQQSEPVYYKSSQVFHTEPDGAAIFPWAETGGWVYVSNSESKEPGSGGVGAIYFDKNGKVLDYQRLLDGSTMNCSGGPTPWGTWVSCEEIENGKVYQVDPFGIRPPQQLSTLDGGFYEAFAYDIRDTQRPKFFVTEDKARGPLRRVIPSNPNWEDPWEMLHGVGTLEYLVLVPNPADDNRSGTYYWTTHRETGKVNSDTYYKNSEGIDVNDHELFFVSKEQRELFILNLDEMTYTVQTTVSGLFDGHPDQLKRLIHNGLLYFCEEGGKENGVHARDENGWYFTILESQTLTDETTGLAFSPDGMHMYVSYQHNGLIFEVWRDDGLPFQAKTLNVKYHEMHQR